RPPSAVPVQRRWRCARSSAAGTPAFTLDALAYGIGGAGIVDADLGIGRAGLLLGAKTIQRHAKPQQAVGRLGRARVLTRNLQELLGGFAIALALEIAFAQPIGRIGCQAVTREV